MTCSGNLARLALALALGLAACDVLAPRREDPVVPAAPIAREIACRTVALPAGFLVEWDASRLTVARATVEVELATDTGWVPQPDLSVEPTSFDSVAFTPLAPGGYRVHVDLIAAPDRRVGYATVRHDVPVPEDPPRRFLSVSEDLGLAEPLGLRLLLAFPDGPGKGSGKGPGNRPGNGPAESGDLESAAGPSSDDVAPFVEDAQRIAQLVLERAAGPTYRVDAAGLLAVEDARDLLLGASEDGRVLPHALGAQALAVVDVRAPRGDDRHAQLGLRLFDLSYRRYRLEQAELRLWNARPLLFEDHVELELASSDEGDVVEALLDAWRDLLTELADDPVLRRYLEFLASEGRGPLVRGAAQKALLNQIGVEFATAGDTENFAAVERDLLFLRDAAAAPAAVIDAADRPAGDERR